MMPLYLFLSDSVSVYLGYDIETLRSRSWYSLIHPRDLSHASAQHCALCEYNFNSIIYVNIYMFIKKLV